MTLEPPILSAAAVRRRSLFVKITCIVVLIVLLHVPIILTHGLLRDRQSYQAQAVGDITALWGHDQRLVGPVLAVPYTYRTLAATNPNATREPALATAVAYFLPDDLQIDGSVTPELRSRGIYDTVVYTAHLKFSGTMRADFAAAGIDPERIDWAKARVYLGVSDLHGVRSVSAWKRAGSPDAPFEAVETGTGAGWPLAAATAWMPGETAHFEFECIVQGSGNIAFAPVGKNTIATLHSTWGAPSFSGSWLPVERRVTEAGFDAEWRVSPFSRGFPQSWTSRFGSVPDIAKTIDNAAFGVRFSRGLDNYGMVERAQKYAVLFFVLVFAVFFLFEVTAELRIHPLQYAMVGTALCLFFLGFLALTEFWTSAAAYGTAAGACTAMVSLYAWSFLRTGRRTLVVAGGLAATYGYLYFVLQSEDYALIAGTVALFAALAIAMFCTRRIDWWECRTVNTEPLGS